MENPEQEIKDVVLALCTRSPAEQEEAVDRYFTPDAAFVHPLCRVPPFSKETAQKYLPGPLSGLVQHLAGGELNSRRLIAGIFRWYKVLSPHIELGVDSVAWDKSNNVLYLGVHQRFALWFVPWYAARVRLVTELQLTPVVDSQGGGSYAAVTSAATNAAPGDRSLTNGASQNASNTSRSRGAGGGGGAGLVNGEPSTTSAHGGYPPNTRFYVARQEDHYQVGELLRFFTLGLGPWLWALVQLYTTLLCVAGAFAVDTGLSLVQGQRKKIAKK